MTMPPAEVASTDTPTGNDHDREQVERANATSLQPVVFIHGL